MIGQRMNRQSRRVRAFALIELLVAITVIAMLMAVLLPVLRKARQQAQSVSCMSNLHQIGIAFVMYAGDSKDFMAGTRYVPDVADQLNPGYPWNVWPNYLNPYFGGTGQAPDSAYAISSATKKVTSCPTDMTLTDPRGNGLRATWIWNNSYSINTALVGSPYDPADYRRLSQVPNASNQVVMLDGGQSTGTFFTYAREEYAAGSIYSAHTIWSRHQLAINLLWADGHVVQRQKQILWVHDFDPTARGTPDDVQFPDDAVIYNVP